MSTAPRPSPSPYSLFIVYFMAFGVAVVGSWALNKGLQDYRWAEASHNWPQTPGLIEQSQVVSERDAKSRVTYFLQISYRYTVDGVDHVGSRVSFGDSRSSNPEIYSQLADEYPRGGEVQVYYDPQDPKNCVLSPGVTTNNYIVLGIGAVLLVTGLALGWQGRRVARQFSR